MLASLAVNPKSAAFPRHNGKYIIQGERKGGCKGWILGGQRALQALSRVCFWGTSQEEAVLRTHLTGAAAWIPAGSATLRCGPGTRVPVRQRVSCHWCGSNYHSHTQLGSHSPPPPESFLFCFCFLLCSVIQEYSFKIIIQEGFSLRW